MKRYSSGKLVSWTIEICSICKKFLSKNQNKSSTQICPKCQKERQRKLHNKYLKKYNKEHHVLSRPYRRLC